MSSACAPCRPIARPMPAKASRAGPTSFLTPRVRDDRVRLAERVVARPAVAGGAVVLDDEILLVDRAAQGLRGVADAVAELARPGAGVQIEIVEAHLARQRHVDDRRADVA